MKRFSLIPICILIIATAMSCKPGVPDKFIQPAEMEEILYDYHVAGSMAQSSRIADNQEYAYRLAALQKHGVTQAEFDSSMVYYMRNTALLRSIYERITKRLEAQEIALGGTASQYADLSATGDTADIWTGERSFVLSSRIPYTVYSYEMLADTSFHKGDKLMMTFDTQFIFQEGVRDAVAVMAMTLNNDSIVSQTMRISAPSHYTLQVSDENNIGVKAVRGYFLLNSETTFGGTRTTLRLMPVYNIRLIRMHKGKELPPAQKADSLQIDTADIRIQMQ